LVYRDFESLNLIRDNFGVVPNKLLFLYNIDGKSIWEMTGSINDIIYYAGKIPEKFGGPLLPTKHELELLLEYHPYTIKCRFYLLRLGITAPIPPQRDHCFAW